MAASIESPREKIARLRATFLEQAPTRLDEARAALNGWQAGGGRDSALALERCLHSLKGTAGSLGFRDWKLLAGEAEAMLIRHRAAAENGVADQPCWPDLAAKLDALSELAAESIGAASAKAGAGTASTDGGENRRSDKCESEAGDPEGERNGLDLPSSKAAKVLVVDDDSLMRHLLRALLQGMGQQVIGEAVNGSDAVEQVARLTPDIVVMDVNMPDMDGLQAMAVIRSNSPGVGVVMVSATPEDQLDHKGSDARCRFILKPVDMADLRAALQALI